MRHEARLAASGLLVTVLCAACGASGIPSAQPTRSPSPAAPTSPGSIPSSMPTVPPERFRFECYTADGRLVSDSTRLEAVWASTEYVRTDHCLASYAGPPPFELTAEEEVVASVAADGGTPTPTLYLDVLEACSRLGADSGDHSIDGTATSVLQASLLVCPKGPQAGLIQEQLAAMQEGATRWTP